MKETHGLLEKPVAVLGGGACGQTFAAEFALEGYEVRLFDLPAFAPQMLGDVLHTRQIELGGEQRNFKWFTRRGTAEIATVTTDMAQALRGAGLVIVSLPAKGHMAFFEAMMPHVQDGQMISIFSDNFGALMLRNMMRRAGCQKDVMIGGWNSMPYGVRMSEPGKLNCILRTRRIVGDTLPSKHGDEFFEVMRALPPFDGVLEVKRADTIIGVDLSNPNPVVHVPGSILNVGAMEVSEMEGSLGIPKGKFSMYKHGMSPAVCKVQLAFHREERKIAEALGVKTAEYREEDFFWKGSIMGIEYWAPFVDVILPPVVGPDSISHRYFTEDIPVGTVARYRLAQKFNVEVPIIESLIRIGSVTCGRDFLKEGLSLSELGIQDMSGEEIISYIREEKT